MAKIIYTLGELRGSIGGLTFQNNASGHTVRQRPVPKKSSTVKQQASHASHQNLLHEWDLLTVTEKDLWNSFASVHDKVDKFGTSKTLTGANWFLSVNYMRLLMGLSILTSPPAYSVPSSAPTFTIQLLPDSLKVFINPTYSSVASNLIIWGSLPTTRVKSTINQIRKYITIITAPFTNPFDITTAWEVATGITWDPLNIFPTSNIFICLENIGKATGITSPMLCAKENISGIAELLTDGSDNLQADNSDYLYAAQQVY